FVIMGGLWLMVEGVRTSARTTNSTVNDLTQWGIASRLWIDSRIANGITIYENNTDQKVERWLRKMVDQRGDFIVFSLSDTNGSAQTFYTKVSGYFYDRAARRIYRFDYDVTNADRIANASLESILTSRRDDILATYE